MKNKSNNKLGVMQGRLLPKFQGRYQAHPVENWKKEFFIAKDIGLDCIEFILDLNDLEKNPLIYFGGINEIEKVIEETGVEIKSICADCFMQEPLHQSKGNAERSLFLLNQLLTSGKQLEVSDIVIPCVDQSSLNSNQKITNFVKNIRPMLEKLEQSSINLALETDLAPQPFADLLNQFDSEFISVNYDIGNSASLGYDPLEELNAYGSRITDIHIKDRMFKGGPVLLGTGNADFKTFFQALKSYNYEGLFIMQAYRDDEGVEVFKRQLEWIKLYLKLNNFYLTNN